MRLFKPAWMRKNDEKALAAVKRLTDQAKLHQAAKEAPYALARLEAVYKLTDQQALADIGSDEHAMSSYVQFAAIDRLSDRSLAEKLYVKAAIKTNYVPIAVIEKITDETDLADIAKAITEVDARDAILKRITSQELLADIARHAKSEHVREKAAGKLTDDRLAQEMYADIAITINGWCSEEALAGIKDQDLVEKVARTSENTRVLLAMAEKLTDDRLAEKAYAKFVAVNAEKDMGYSEKSVARDALKKVNDQELLADIAEKDCTRFFYKPALEKVTDPKLVRRVAQNAVYWVCRIDAAEKLNDPVLLQEVYTILARNHEDKDVRKIAIENSTDRAFLNEIVNGGEEYRYEWEASSETYDHTEPGTYVGAHDGYDVYRIETWDCVLDLRDTARERLEKLDKMDANRVNAEG